MKGMVSASESRRYGIIAFWLATMASLGIIVIGGLEFSLRAFPQFLPRGMEFRLHDQAMAANDLHSLPHDEIGYLWQPQTSERFEGWKFAFTYTTDEYGFRNGGPRPDRADIVVIGDSQAFGFGVNDGEEWPRRLAERSPGVEVVNLGLIGAAPQQFVEVFEAYGAPLQPKVVVVAFFPPNAIDTGRLFHNWVAEGKADGFDARRMRRLVPGASPGLLGWIKAQLRESYAALAIYYGLRQLTSTSDMITMAFEHGGELRLVASRYGEAAAMAASGHVDFERVIETLGRLQKKVRASGAEILVVPFPSKEEVLLSMMGERPYQVAGPFITELERRGIAALDLIPYLQEGATAGQKLFFEIDLHPNPAGQKLIALALSEYLQRQTAKPTRH
jgi:hypothetical protein